jgi:hypothetical protein
VCVWWRAEGRERKEREREREREREEIESDLSEAASALIARVCRMHGWRGEGTHVYG